MTILIGVFVLVAILMTIRFLRTIPWAATIRLAALPLAAVGLTVLCVHHNINPYELLAWLVPDFGGTP